MLDWLIVWDIVRLVIAGFLGGLLRSIYFAEPWKGYLRNCVVGAVTAYYLGPLAPMMFSPWFPEGGAHDFRELSGFLVGCGGVAMIGWINDYVETKRKGKELQ